MKSHFAAVVFVGLVLAGCGDSGSTRMAPPPGAKVFFIEPVDGAEPASPVTVRFGLEGINFAMASSEERLAIYPHLLIDTQIDDVNRPIESHANQVRMNLDQTETQIELTPGKHTLQLVLGNYQNIPHDPMVQSDVITITVK